MRLIAALVASLVWVPAASAATVHVDVDVQTGKGCTVEPASCVDASVVFRAAGGEANDVQLSMAGSSMLVRDAGAPLQAGSGCQQQGPSQARCSPPEGPSMGIVFVDADLGDGGDRLQNAANMLSQIHGGAGDDHLIGGTSTDVLLGEAGRDRTEGGEGFDYFTDTAGVEPDVVDGGPGRDTVSYVPRRARVTVDLRGPAQPSGEAGEGDSLAGIEEAHGGRGADVMRAGAGPVRFVGHAGDDRLIGSFGNDQLFGESGDDKIYGLHGRDRLVGGHGNDGINAGCGPAKLFGQEGRDRLYSRNGAADRVHGGTGRDIARIDQLDVTDQVERRLRQHIDACAQ